MSAIRTRSGLLVRRDGEAADPQSLHAHRLAGIAALVDELGVVGALDRYEAAHAVLVKLSADAEQRGHLGAALGYAQAANYIADSLRLLVEHHG